MYVVSETEDNYFDEFEAELDKVGDYINTMAGCDEASADDSFGTQCISQPLCVVSVKVIQRAPHRGFLLIRPCDITCVVEEGCDFCVHTKRG